MNTDKFYQFGFVDREDGFNPELIEEILFPDAISD